MSDTQQLVIFSLHGEQYALPITTVQEIIRHTEPRSLTSGTPWLKGVINLRGKIIPVIDLRKRFGEKEITSTKKNRILVAEVDQKRVGLIVDAASEVLKIPPSEVDAPPNVFEEGELNYVTGVGKLQGRLIMMVELSKILQRGELRRLGEFADTHTPPAAEAASA